MARSRLLVGVVLVAVLAGGVLLASPWWSLSGLVQAYNTGDRQRLTRYVDFPRLRESLRGQITSKLHHELGKGAGDGEGQELGAALGTMLGDAVFSRLVDALVTPEGIAELVEQRTGLKRDPAQRSTRVELARTLHARVDLDWIDLHNIRATIYDKDGKLLTHALLEREVLTWRVVDVDLPEAGK